MIEEEIAQCVALLRRGLVTVDEFSHAVLLRIARRKCGNASGDLLAALPGELQEHIKKVLKQIESDQFVWVPFILGHEWSEKELAELEQQVRLIQKVIMVE